MSSFPAPAPTAFCAPRTEAGGAAAPELAATGVPQRALHQVQVIEMSEVAPRHFRLHLLAPALAARALPGQFIHVLPHPIAPASASANAPADAAHQRAPSYDPLLRRAFSLMNADPLAATVDVLFRVEGRGTHALAGARAGDHLDIIGPLGRPFDIAAFDQAEKPETLQGAGNGALFHVKQARPRPRAILVGGGVGVPPLVFLSRVLGARNVEVEALIGARTGAEVIGQEELNASGTGVKTATDDGSAGHQGRVTDLLQASLERDASAIIYACGPWAMLKAVARQCAQGAVPCQVSLEESMPCGIGVCNGCVVRAKKPFAGTSEGVASPTSETLTQTAKATESGSPGAQPSAEALAERERVGDEWSPYQNYRRICVEGPACWAHEIEWGEL